jgi:hypothetical protein
MHGAHTADFERVKGSLKNLLGIDQEDNAVFLS